MMHSRPQYQHSVVARPPALLRRAGSFDGARSTLSSRAMSESSADAHRHLLSPGRIGGLALRNRIVLTPMGTNPANKPPTS